MLIDEQLAENRLRFTAMKTQEIFLDTNEYGEADTVYRYFTMRLKDAAAFFGEESLPETWKVDLKNKERLNDEKTIIHAVYRRDAQIDSDSLGAKNKPYASVYLAEADEALLYEGGYDEFPYAVFRWEPLPGTAYSDSPSIQAYDDIWLLNKIDESRIKIAQLSSDPFYNVPDSMRGEEIKVVPSGFNYYTKPNEILAPVNVGANYNITLEIAQAIEDRVKDWFSVDFFLALQHQNVKDMTATAVMELQGEKAATLSDLIVNLNGALAKIIQRSFNLLWKQRKLPAPPPELAQSGAQLKIDFLGPLAQAQKKYHESAGIAQGISLIGAVAKVFGPSALAGIDEHQTLKAGLEGAGFPQNAIREDADRDAILQAQAQAQQQAAQQQAALEQQKNVLGNLNKLNEPVQPGSSLDQMNRQMGGGV
jgi:hypothetical protein